MIRLIGSLPLTPGGLGVVELGLTSLLVEFGGGQAEVVAAVLVYRVLTIAPTLVLGLLAAATWKRHNPGLSRPTDAEIAAATRANPGKRPDKAVSSRDGAAAQARRARHGRVRRPRSRRLEAREAVHLWENDPAGAPLAFSLADVLGRDRRTPAGLVALIGDDVAGAIAARVDGPRAWILRWSVAPE